MNFFREMQGYLNILFFPLDLVQAISKTSLVNKAFAIISRSAKSLGNLLV